MAWSTVGVEGTLHHQSHRLEAGGRVFPAPHLLVTGQPPGACVVGWGAASLGVSAQTCPSRESHKHKPLKSSSSWGTGTPYQKGVGEAPNLTHHGASLPGSSVYYRSLLVKFPNG